MMAVHDEKKSHSRYFDSLDLGKSAEQRFLLIFKSYTSPSYHLKNEKLFERDFSGEIILDRMLHVGNSKDRFIKYQIVEGTVIDDSGVVINLDRKNDIRRMANEMYREYPEIIANSILNKSQKKLLLHGLSI